MWSSRLFWKLFLSYAAFNLVATIVFVVTVSRWQEDQVIGQLERRLRDSGVLIRNQLAEQWPDGPTETLQSRVRGLGRDVGIRVTLVDMSGQVLADSSRDSLVDVGRMENHKERLELVAAAKTGEGRSRRVSPSLGEPMLYVALRAERQGRPVGLVRAAMPMTEVRAQVTSIQNLIWALGSLVSLAVVAVSYVVATRLVRPVATLTEAAEAIAAGDYHQHVYFDSRDELGALAASFNRMSERLDTRDTELRESSQRLTTVLEGMDEGVLSLDDRQRIVLANSAAGRLLGFSPKAAEGRPLLEVVRNHKLHSALLESQSARESRRVEIEVGESDSRVLSIYATLVPGERTTRFVLVLQDITDLRRLESMRQEFVANVSHELKTPLSSIKAYAETLSHGAINDAEHNLRFVNSIEEQAERLHQLILDLLSLARIESGQQAFDIAAVNLPSVVLACLAEHRANADSKGVQLTSAGEGDSLKVRADEEGTRQILNNLVANAINYTPEGGSVVVHWRREESKGVIEVADTGIGISPEHLPRLFERFYRVDKARSRELGGTGLGLSIVKHLTQSFGGTVEVVSQPGRGTTFTVRLPLA